MRLTADRVAPSIHAAGRPAAATVPNTPCLVQAIWAADGPGRTLVVYRKARAAGLPRPHIVPGKHLSQPDQTPGIAQKSLSWPSGQV